MSRRNLDSRIDSLKDLAEKLNEASNLAAEIFDDYEGALGSTGIGISYWLPDLLEKEHRGSGADRYGSPAEYYTGYQIGWAKVGKQWHLAFRRTEIEEYLAGIDENGREQVGVRDEPGSPESLANAPRSVRVHAVRLLDNLVDGLVGEAESLVRAVEAARPILKDHGFVIRLPRKDREDAETE